MAANVLLNFDSGILPKVLFKKILALVMWLARASILIH